jgi:hypothetical protein
MATLTPPGERPGRREPGPLNPDASPPAPDRRRRPDRSVIPFRPDEIFPRGLFAHPTSVLVHGRTRPLVQLAVYALAEATTPQFQWVDIGVPGEDRGQWDPVQLGWVPEERLWRVEHAEALRPEGPADRSALFELIRSDEPPAMVARITEFLGLPETSQRILATGPPKGTPGVVAVPNAQKLLDSFSASQVPSILHAHRTAGFSVVIGIGEPAGANESAFDFVFHLDGESIAHWRDARWICEKGIASGPLGDARPLRLEEVALLASVLARATGAPGTDPIDGEPSVP